MLKSHFERLREAGGSRARLTSGSEPGSESAHVLRIAAKPMIAPAPRPGRPRALATLSHHPLTPDLLLQDWPALHQPPFSNNSPATTLPQISRHHVSIVPEEY